MSPPSRPNCRKALAGFLVVYLTVGISGCARKAISKPANSGPGSAGLFVVSALTFSPDGKRLAASVGPKATIWDVESGQEVAVLENASPIVFCLAYSPDGKTIAGGIDKSITLWDADTGKIKKTLDGHQAFIRGLAFTPDGKSLVAAAGLYNFTTTIVEIWVWDVDAGKKIADIPPGQGVITCMALTNDRKIFATGSTDKSVKVWDMAQKKDLATLKHQGGINCLAFSKDGKTLAAADGQFNVTLWNTSTYTELAKLPGPDEIMISSLAFSPSGKFLAGACDDQNIWIWDVAAGKVAATLKGHSRPVKAVAYDTDDKTLASGGRDSEVRIWNPVTEEARVIAK
jgi:WD40 repeat protein